MRTTTTLFILLLGCCCLWGQTNLPGNPTEVLRAYSDFQTNKLLPQSKTNYRYDMLGNITYQASYWVEETDSTGPSWRLEQETWNTYSAAGLLEHQFVERGARGRTTSEAQFDANGNTTLFTFNRFNPESGELVSSSRSESSYEGKNIQESMTYNLDLNTGQYNPAFRAEYLYDEKGRRIQDVSYIWNLSIGDWDSSWQVRFQYEVDQDSAVIYESYSYDKQTAAWNIVNRFFQIFDNQGRLLQEINGTETSGIYRTFRTYDDQTGVETWKSDGKFPGDSVWTPFYEVEQTFEDGLLVRSFERSGWDTTRQEFLNSTTRNNTYREDGRLDQVVQINRWYDPFSGQNFLSEDRTQYEYDFYCDDKLRYEQARQSYTGAPVQFRTTYSYADQADCDTEVAPVSVRAYPSPVSNQDAFLRVESAWLRSPGVKGEIVDLMGRRHASFTGQQGWAVDVSVKDLNPGHYFIHLYKDGEKRSTKFVKTE